MIIVIPCPGHQFNSLKEMQDELNPVVSQVIQQGCSNLPINYFTDGGNIGQKFVITFY
jgi:hypothetical protein